MGENTPFRDRHLAPRYALKQGNPLLHQFVDLNVHRSGLTLQGGDEFGAHGVTLKSHPGTNKSFDTHRLDPHAIGCRHADAQVS